MNPMRIVLFVGLLVLVALLIACGEKAVETQRQKIVSTPTPVNPEERGSTLDIVKARQATSGTSTGALRCAARIDLPGFGTEAPTSLDPDSRRNLGFDVDICRAVASAIFSPRTPPFGLPHVLEIVPVTADEVPTFGPADVEIISPNVNFSVAAGTNREELFTEISIPIFYDGDEPKTLTVANDDEWIALVERVITVLINAEELGVTKKNILELKKGSDDPLIKRMLSATYGPDVSLRPKFGVDTINDVGNYGEIYDRNFGPESDNPRPRGPNELQSRGGKIWAPPIELN